MMKKFIELVRKETVLVIAWVLAIISAFFVKPNIKYIDYIDFRTLGILWSLMVIMEGLSCNGLFEKIGYKLLKKTKNVWQLSITLVFICFFSSMLITNDVALITFVPFTMMILGKCEKQNLLIPIIVLQTIAANLGSMLTPIGNPQNLYLYGLWGVNIFTFIKTILPYSIVSFFLLLLFLFYQTLLPYVFLNLFPFVLYLYNLIPETYSFVCKDPLYFSLYKDTRYQKQPLCSRKYHL